MKSNSPLVNVTHRLQSEPEILQDTNFTDNGGDPQRGVGQTPRQLGAGKTIGKDGGLRDTQDFVTQDLPGPGGNSLSIFFQSSPIFYKNYDMTAMATRIFPRTPYDNLAIG